ncbi:MAG TPA: hypothetical protein VFA38_11420 [Nitrospirales bacterium]|nr:hypothetical protein [Nitrospirales bacterium]
MNIRIAIVLIALTVTGCQSLKIQGSGALDNSTFMSVWSTYQHCEAGGDVETMRNDAFKLAQVARESVPMKPVVPGALKQYVSDPPHRLAVEPSAMAAACGLHAGNAALEAGRMGVADEMYRLVLSYPEGRYPYYVSQARAGLDHVKVIREPVLVQVPSAFVPLSD